MSREVAQPVGAADALELCLINFDYLGRAVSTSQAARRLLRDAPQLSAALEPVVQGMLGRSGGQSRVELTAGESCFQVDLKAVPGDPSAAITALVTDITIRKRVETLLRRLAVSSVSSALTRETMEAIGAHTLIVGTVGEQGRARAESFSAGRYQVEDLDPATPWVEAIAEAAAGDSGQLEALLPKDIAFAATNTTPALGLGGHPVGWVTAAFAVQPVEPALSLSAVQVLATRLALGEEESRAEKRRHMERGYKRFFLQSSEGICLIQFDPPVSARLAPAQQVQAMLEAGRVTECNDAYAQLRGLPYAATLIGAKLSELQTAGCHLDFDLLSALTQSGYRLAEWEPVAAESGLRLKVSAVAMGTRGSIDQVWCVARNVTDQAKAADALADSEQKYRSLFETMTAGVIYTTPHGRIIAANAAAEQILGLELTGGVEIALRDGGWSVAPLDTDAAAGRDARTVADLRERFPAEGLMMRVWNPRKGDWRWIFSNATFTHGRRGETSGLLLTFTDVTEIRQAHMAATESEQKFQAVIDFAPMATLLCSLDASSRLLIDATNPAACQLFELDKEQACGLLVRDVLVGLSEEALESLTAIGRNGGTWSAQVECPSAAVRRICEVHGFQTGPGKVALMMHDITERRAAEEQLRHSEDQFRRVWEGTPEAMRLSDPEGIVLRVNEAYCRLARKARTELENRPFWIWRSPDERPASIENYRRRDVIGWPEREERQLKTWDGRTVWAELWHAEIESPPGKRAILTAFRDVTAQRLAERALTLSERRFQELMESVSLAGALTDSEGRLTFCNSFLLNLTGYTIEDALGQPIEKFVFPEDLPKVLFAKKSALQDETPRVRAECRVLTKVGQLRTIDWSTSAYRNAEGKLVGIALLGADVTEQREMEERQRQSQRLESLGRLAGGIAHDFNNLLTVINGYADMALANLDARDPLFPLLQEICNAGERGAELTQQLLAFGRKQILRSQILDLNRVVQEAERMLRRIIGDDIQLECRLARDLRLVQADPGQIHQVILNLAVNSRDAMANGGRLVISTRDVSIPPGVFGDTEAGEYVALEFEDTGTGMTPEVRDRMFEPFFTTKEAGGGTGLGLAMVYGIVKQSEGQIEVITDIGKGTLIRVLLPAREGVAEKTEEEEAHADLEGSETILLVEDNDEVRQYMTIALKEFGYRVISAGTPAEALLLASTFRGPIDLLLTDVVMPGLKGPELAAKFRDLHPEAKVLYVSGNTEGVFNVEESKEVTLLPKPFGPAVLGQTIRDLLGKPKVRRTVLVVDDEAETRQFFARVLQQAGFEVRQAENGRSALQQMNQSAVDVVVTDLVMPEQEGLETIREIRLQHPAVPVVAVSGAFAAQYLRMARVLGATAALPKPVKAEDLVQVVTKLAETRS